MTESHSLKGTPNDSPSFNVTAQRIQRLFPIGEQNDQHRWTLSNSFDRRIVTERSADRRLVELGIRQPPSV